MVLLNNMLLFKPTDITIDTVEETPDYGSFEIHPLNPGYGHTVGNALRRVLLSSLTGAALVQVQIEGVDHEFTTIEGVKEDVSEVLLNLKKVCVRMEGEDAVALRLEKEGAGAATAGDIGKVAGVEIVNPDQLIATLTDKDSSLVMDFIAEKGTGYSPSEDRTSNKIGVIPLDAVFSPVLQVSYEVLPTRVGQITNLDKLALEVRTDGTVEPLEAVKEAAEILENYFHRFTRKEEEVEKVKAERAEAKQLAKKKKEINSLPIEELELPTRLTNSLRKGGIKSIGDLLGKDGEEWENIKNVGSKSVEKIKKALNKKGWDDFS